MFIGNVYVNPLGLVFIMGEYFDFYVWLTGFFFLVLCILTHV